MPVVVVNKPGAGSTIGMREVASAKPDGYTLGMAASAQIEGLVNLMKFLSPVTTDSCRGVLAV